MRPQYRDYIPFSYRITDLDTNGERENQILEQFVLLRHLPSDIETYFDRTSNIPWIDQAKFYFSDAFSSNWQSAGLLFYYSYMNFAKAFLIHNGRFTKEEVIGSNFFHGVKDDKTQANLNLLDYKINVFQPNDSRGSKNVFSHFYEELIKEQWPFVDKIELTLKDIAGYCTSISHELYELYDIKSSVFDCQSILYSDNKNSWCEILLPSDKIEVLKNNIESQSDSIQYSTIISAEKRNLWHEIRSLSALDLSGFSSIEFLKTENESSDFLETVSNVKRLVDTIFSGHTLPLPINDSLKKKIWLFNPKINISGKEIKWHPLLSDYLFSYVLSTLLRYNPQVINEKDSYLAKAWCDQSSLNALRYLLIAFTGIRLN